MFSVVRADAKTGKNRREVILVKMSFSFVKVRFFGLGWQKKEEGSRMAHLRVTPLSCFPLLFFPVFEFSWHLKKIFSFFSLFLYFFQTHFGAAISITVYHRCLLRCRCYVKKWCPDEKKRDSWDWVGPPAWRRACFNSPEWGGGSSPFSFLFFFSFFFFLFFFLFLFLFFSFPHSFSFLGCSKSDFFFGLTCFTISD